MGSDPAALGHFLDDAMKREDHVRAIADGKLFADIDARRLPAIASPRSTPPDR